MSSAAAGVREWDVIGDVPISRNRHAAIGYPKFDLQDQVLISRNQYILSWNIAERVPQWVGWAISRKFLGDVDRTGNFRADTDLSQYLADWSHSPVSPTEYRGSCIDRGHQVASGDRTATVQDNQSTFMMSNIAPQTAFLNRRNWVSFERFLRRLVTEQGHEVIAFSGGNGPVLGYMGAKSDIRIHSRNFKAAVIKPAGSSGWDLEKMRLLVVDFPNKTSTGTNPLTDREQACFDSEHTIRIGESNRTPIWMPYVSTLEAIEESSDLDLGFLSRIKPITADELNDLVNLEIKFGFQYFNPLEMLETTLRPM